MHIRQALKRESRWMAASQRGSRRWELPCARCWTGLGALCERCGKRQWKQIAAVNDCIVKYSVDPALTDIRGEFPRQAEANLGGNAGCRSLAWGAAAFFVSQEIPMELPVKQKGTACLRCALARRCRLSQATARDAECAEAHSFYDFYLASFS